MIRFALELLEKTDFGMAILRIIGEKMIPIILSGILEKDLKVLKKLVRL